MERHVASRSMRIELAKNHPHIFAESDKAASTALPKIASLHKIMHTRFNWPRLLDRAADQRVRRHEAQLRGKSTALKCSVRAPTTFHLIQRFMPIPECACIHPNANGRFSNLGTSFVWAVGISMLGSTTPPTPRSNLFFIVCATREQAPVCRHDCDYVGA